MTLKDMFNATLSMSEIRRQILDANPEIPRNVFYPGQWLQKHNPEKYNSMFREWCE